MTVRLETAEARPGRWEVAGLVWVTGLILAVGAWACLGVEERLAYLFYDDAYYYFGVARNLAHGAGSTFDGINASNGYHPLWCWLLVPLFWLVDSPGVAMRIIGLLWYGLAAGSALALWWALRPRTGATGAVLSAALFGLHPLLALQLSRPNGLETPLLALLVAVFLGVYERALDTDRRPPGLLRMGLLGALLGAAILARLDAGVLAVAAAVLLLVRAGQAKDVREVVLGVGALTLGALLLAGPSLVWNWGRFGSPLPVSGRVVEVFAARERQDLGGFGSLRNAQRRAYYGVEAIPLEMARNAVGGTALLRPLWKLGKPAGAAVLVFVLLTTAGAIRLRTRCRPITGDALSLLALMGILHYLVYVSWLWIGGEKGFRLYYFMPQAMLVAASLGTLLGAGLCRLGPRQAWRRGAVASMLLLLSVFLLVSIADRFFQTPSEPGSLAERRLFGWIRHQLPPSAVVATTDAGRLGFFCGRTVVNIDGLINDQRFLEALRQGRKGVARYVHDSPITHLVAGMEAPRGYDPERPEIPPQRFDPIGSLMYELGRIPGCRLRQVGAVENWLIFEVIRQTPPPPA